MKTFTLVAIVFTCFQSLITNAQTYIVPGAQQQPAWVFPIWFEDFNGDKDTLYICYDPASTNDDVFFNPDTLFGEKIIALDTSKFNATMYPPDFPNYWGWKTVVVPGLYNIYVYFTKGRMPLKVKWDRNLFYDSVLLNIPIPDLLPYPLIEILCPCNDFNPNYNNCPNSWPLAFVPEDPIGCCPNGFYTDSIIFLGDTIGPLSNVSMMTLPLEFWPLHEPVGLSKIPKEAFFTIYPNPFQNNISIFSRTQEQADYMITNMLGMKVKEGTLIGFRNNFDTQSLRDGFYHLLIKTRTSTFFYKLIKL